ncbi:NAD(+) diphosphatase [Neptunomonas antarctica]|uniref:NAD(+) diphosphatase n=1 Tax=Neptunomonas antarctica TaxID=619304 RepID=A0A1N7LS69_9GAMM|nr:NAD(+) diphosphatase [Neptunomonas antarctica]SIS76634.1 NAD+ diphosphatase [Neptunomonas antarctica]
MDGRYIVGSSGSMYLHEPGVYLYPVENTFSASDIEAIYPVGVLQGIDVQLIILARGSQISAEKANLRNLLSVSQDEHEYVLLSRAAQLIVWHNEHRFCGRCGHEMTHHKVDLAKHCSHCDLVQYPRISPCIIVLVVDGDRCLLARSPRFPPGRFSTLAGFIEAGETAEAAVHREVREEVGIEIKNVRYIQSQSWPFPHALMLGFVADYAAGELLPDGVEIEEAHWYQRDAMPDLPPSFAISYTLIERFLKGEE